MKIILIISFVALIMGYVIGLKHGRFITEDMNSAPIAAITSIQLEILKEGNVDVFIKSQEVNLDARISQYRKFDDSLYKYMWPELHEALNNAIVAATSYRSNNPFIIETLSEEFLELYPEEKRTNLKKNRLELIDKIENDKKVMIERYANRENNHKD